jgi:malate dehydrogenase (oxaloacetate-decarboxylating)(NADP+)
MMMVDSVGVIWSGRTEGMNPYKERFAHKTPARTLADAMRGADVFLGCSKAGTVTPEMIASMNDRPIVFALANPDPEIGYKEAVAVRRDLIMATGRSDYPNQVNNVLGFPFIFRGALDVRAREINEPMKVAAARALAQLAREEVPESVSEAYGNQQFRFGPEYIIPKPFDGRVLWWVAPAVARAAIESGVARTALDIDAYREALERRMSKTPEVMRRLHQRARQSRRRIVFPEGDRVRVLRAAQQIVDDGIARPILLGEEQAIVARARELELHDLLDEVEIVQPRESPHFERYVEEYRRLRERRGVTRDYARRVMGRRNPYGMMMVKLGDADGLVSGLTMSYAETIRPALQIVGKRPGVERVCGVYLLALASGDIKFFADATVNIAPSAETLAEIAIQVADMVKGLDITPRVAMVSFSNFGSSNHPEARLVADAVRIVNRLRPDLEVDGELQADTALQFEQMKAAYPFCRLQDEANVLIFPSLVSGNVAYKLMSAIGGAAAVGPMLLGLAKPISVLPPNASVETIVQMTAYTVSRA